MKYIRTILDEEINRLKTIRIKLSLAALPRVLRLVYGLSYPKLVRLEGFLTRVAGCHSRGTW